VDGSRSLQTLVHNIDRGDQTVRNKLIVAGEDPVAADRLVAYLMGYNPWDKEFLHMAVQRELGTMEPRPIEVVADNPDRMRWRVRAPRQLLVGIIASEKLVEAIFPRPDLGPGYLSKPRSSPSCMTTPIRSSPPWRPLYHNSQRWPSKTAYGL